MLVVPKRVINSPGKQPVVPLGFREGGLDVGAFGNSARNTRKAHGGEVRFAHRQGDGGNSAGGRFLPILYEIRHHSHKLGHPVDECGAGSLQG